MKGKIETNNKKQDLLLTIFIWLYKLFVIYLQVVIFLINMLL